MTTATAHHNVRVEVHDHSAKVIQLFKQKHDVDLTPMEIMIKLRLSSLSLPALLALAIVDSNAHAKYPMVYVGEVEGFFMQYYKAGDNPWSYAAVGRMLNILAKKEFLNKERHGRYVAYGMTTKGIKLIAQLGLHLNKR